MKRPSAERFQRGRFFFAGEQHGNEIAPAANRDNRRKPLGVRQAQAPGAIAAHAQASQIDPAGIDGIITDDLIEQSQQDFVGPDLILRTLRRNQDKGEIRAVRDNLRGPVGRHFPDITATLTGSVEEKHQGPALFRLGDIILGKEEQITHLGVYRLFELELLHYLRVNGICARTVRRVGSQAGIKHRQASNRKAKTPWSAAVSKTSRSQSTQRDAHIQPRFHALLPRNFYISLSLGKSWESTRPTGSFLRFTTIRSSIFRSLKIFSASTDKASCRTRTGFRVMQAARGFFST